MEGQEQILANGMSGEVQAYFLKVATFAAEHDIKSEEWLLWDKAVKRIATDVDGLSAEEYLARGLTKVREVA